MKRSWLLLLTLLGCGAPNEEEEIFICSESSSNVVAPTSMGGALRSKISFSLPQDADQNFAETAAKSATVWNEVLGIDLLSVNFENVQASQNYMVVVRNWDSYGWDSKVAGRTLRSIGNNSEQFVDIFFNYQYYSFRDLSDQVEKDESVFDLESIVTHEMGHAIGLDHNDDRASVMYPHAQRTAQYRKPCRLDMEKARKLYEGFHVD